MSNENSYIGNYLPNRRNLQNRIGSLPPLSIFSYFATKFFYSKQQEDEKGAESESSAADNAYSEQRFLPASLEIILKKFSDYTKSAHSYIFGKSGNDLHVYQNSTTSNEDLSRAVLSSTRLNPNDYCHALQNTWEDVPHCCVEPWIMKGYVLPYMPWRYYLKVLWIPNNEALNVWTHLLPSLYFMWLLYVRSQTIDLFEKWPLLFVSVSAVLLTLCSALAHTFHSRSSYHHSCLFILDYFGITLYAYSSMLSHFFVSSDLPYYALLGPYNLAICTLICFAGFYCCAFSQTGRKESCTKHRNYKLVSNGIGYFYGMVPLFYRLATSPEMDTALFYHAFQFVFMILSPIWYASDIPQKYWPGTFDIVGHSHQIFHIFGALGCYFDVHAIHMDVMNGRWGELHDQPDYPSSERAFLYLFVLICYCVAVGVYFCWKIMLRFPKEVDIIRRCPCAWSSLYNGNYTTHIEMKKKE